MRQMTSRDPSPGSDNELAFAKRLPQLACQWHTGDQRNELFDAGDGNSFPCDALLAFMALPLKQYEPRRFDSAGVGLLAPMGMGKQEIAIGV